MGLFAVKTAIILMLAVGITRGMRRSSAASRHVVWTCALLAVLCLPVASAIVPALPLPWLPAAPSADAWLVSAASQLPEAEIFEAVPAPPMRDPVAARRTAATRRPDGAAPAEPIVALLWLVGSVAVLGRLGVGLWRRAALERQCGPLAPGALRETADRYAAAMGIRRRIQWLEAPTDMMPATWGLFRPRVLLPPGAHSWSTDRLRLVLVHELSHVVRFDALTAAIAFLATALAWWNPLVWVAARRAQLERERACDDAVIRAGLAPSRYAEELLSLARALPSPFGQRLALAMAKPQRIERRLSAILDGAQRRTGTSHVVATAASVLMALQLPLAAISIGADPPATLPAVARRFGFTDETRIRATRALPAVPPSSHAAPIVAGPAQAPQPIPAGEFGAGAYRIGPGLTPPVRVKEVTPRYTPEAMRAKIQGTVELDVVIDATGAVSDARVATSLDRVFGLDEQALHAVRASGFTPARLNGTPVAALVHFEMAFRLDGPPQVVPAGEFGAGAYRIQPAPSGFVAPVRVTAVHPQYTPEAMRQKIQGTVIVEAVVSPDGTVEDARVVQSLDPTYGLDANALDAARRTAFAPAQLNGTPVRCVVTFDLTFTLRL